SPPPRAPPAMSPLSLHAPLPISHDRPIEASGQEPGDAAHVINMDMGDDQGANTMDREIDVQIVGVRPAARRTVAALEQTAVDQQAVLFVEHQFMCGAGDAVDRAVVKNVEPVCHAFFPESGSRLKSDACRNNMV